LYFRRDEVAMCEAKNNGKENYYGGFALLRVRRNEGRAAMALSITKSWQRVASTRDRL
jgi:hypothetical protein